MSIFFHFSNIQSTHRKQKHYIHKAILHSATSQAGLYALKERIVWVMGGHIFFIEGQIFCHYPAKLLRIILCFI